MNFDYVFKVIMVGDAGVGKTSIAQTFVNNFQVLEHKTTIGIDFLTKTLNVHDKIVKLQIWDSGGQERFADMIRSYYSGCHILIIVFSKTNLTSFEHVKIWLNRAMQNNPKLEYKILLGNKNDLADQFEVSESQIQSLCEELGLDYFDVSAKNGQNITNAFQEIAEKTVKKNIIAEDHDFIVLKKDDDAASNNNNGNRKCCGGT